MWLERNHQGRHEPPKAVETGGEGILSTGLQGWQAGKAHLVQKTSERQTESFTVSKCLAKLAESKANHSRPELTREVNQKGLPALKLGLPGRRRTSAAP